MTRGQFLATLGVGFISLFGFSAMLGAVTGNDTSRQQVAPNVYGGQNYGP